MKTTKKLLTFILSAVMVFTLATSTISTFVAKTWAIESDWVFAGVGEGMHVLQYKGAGGDIVIPDTAGGRPVTEIRPNVFKNNESITSVIFPDSINNIDADTFYGCLNLQSVTFGSGLQYIGNNAFFCCRALTSITIPDSVTFIGESAFGGCIGLESVIIGNGLTSISRSAFGGCSNLTDINFGSSVTTIGVLAFSNCSSLTHITMPDSLTVIDSSAFYRCVNLVSVKLSNNITNIKNEAFSENTSLASIVIPKSVNTIGSLAFNNCSSLKTVVNLSDLPITIGSDNYGRVAYYANKIIVPNMSGAVDFCVNGDTLYIGGENIPDYSYSSPAPWDEYKTALKHIIILDGVKSIGKYAFNGFAALESVEIPASITSIGNYAFRACAALGEITLKGTSYELFNYSFLGCNSIETVNLLCGSLDKTKIPNYASISFNYSHYFDDWQIVYAPSYESCGMITHSCIGDGVYVENFELPALNSGEYAFDFQTEKYNFVKDGQILSFDLCYDNAKILGAQYRTEGPAGIRFCTEVFATHKNGGYAVDGNNEVAFDNIDTYGTLIIPLDLIDDPADLVLTANGKIASMLFPSGIEYLNIEGHKFYHKFNDRIQFTAVLIGIPDAAPGGINYDRDFVAVSYIKYKTGEIIYSDPCVRNIEQLVNASV